MYKVLLNIQSEGRKMVHGLFCKPDDIYVNTQKLNIPKKQWESRVFRSSSKNKDQGNYHAVACKWIIARKWIINFAEKKHIFVVLVHNYAFVPSFLQRVQESIYSLSPDTTIWGGSNQSPSGN